MVLSERGEVSVLHRSHWRSSKKSFAKHTGAATQPIWTVNLQLSNDTRLSSGRNKYSGDTKWLDHRVLASITTMNTTLERILPNDRGRWSLQCNSCLRYLAADLLRKL